jgi:Mg-chelatase subunit ChlD
MRFLCPIATVMVTASLLVQQPPSMAQSGSDATPPVILISAQHKDGSPADLATTDLEVRVDGQSVDVSDVHRIPRPQLGYCVLFDSSGSQRQRWSQQRDQTTEFLSKVPQSGRDYGVFTAFNGNAYLDAEGTDPQKLIHAISKQLAQGGTALYDAMVACSDYLLKHTSNDVLRMMFIFSDGGDNASHLNRDKAAQELARSDIRVFVVGDMTDRIGLEAMKEFTQETGGRIYFTGKQKELDPVADINLQLGHLFAMTLTKPLPNDRIFKLKVKCTKKDTLVIAPQKYSVALQPAQ